MNAPDFIGPDLSLAHEFSHYPTEDYQRLPVQAIRTRIVKTQHKPLSECVPYFFFRIHPDGFLISMN